MTNVTQCPNCSSIFAITDEQFSASKGIVRCGTCREKFTVVFLPDQDELVVNKNVLLDANDQQSENPHGQSDLLRILSEHAKREEMEEAEEDIPISLVESHLENAFVSDTDNNAETEGDFEGKSDVDVEGDAEASVRVDGEGESDADVAAEELETPSELFTNSFSEEISEQGDSDEGDVEQDGYDYSHIPDQPLFEQSTNTFTLDEDNLLSDELIDEVDSLIDNKLLGEDYSESALSDETIATDELDLDAGDIESDQPLRLTPSLGKRLASAALTLFLLAIAATLFSTLSYQLWLKQTLPEFMAKPVATFAPFISPVAEGLAERYEISLPVRQDLNNLQLVSAHTEAHPSRASTILLRISFLNKAIITQPLPKLELSLTDESGRIVSRRSFAPNDYLYNNATENMILANELKKVTVELLAFPKQAHGYELKMVN